MGESNVGVVAVDSDDCGDGSNEADLVGLFRGLNLALYISEFL